MDNNENKLTPEEPGMLDRTPQLKQGGGSDMIISIFEWIEMFVICFAAVLLFIIFIGRHSPVSGDSMKDTLHNNDVLFVSNLFYTPKVNDIVVFQSPQTGYSEPYVKRIIATGGQTVDIDFESWTVKVDGKVIDETYVLREEGVSMLSYGNDHLSLTVPEGHVFVMGDNRNHSYDSRAAAVGTIDERYLLGRVVFRFFPFVAHRFGVVK